MVSGSKLRMLALGLIPVVVFAAFLWIDSTFGTSGRGRDYVIRLTLPPSGTVGLPKVEGPLDASRPLIVIDPGHGGHDPGAGKPALLEKALTLSLARALRDELLRQGGVRVALTRDEDSFLSLTERSGIARRLNADLFLSIHADSVASGDATGASVYVLSDRGSNEAAARIAERENRADTVNGVALSDTSGRVGSILVDLAQDDARARSAEFAGLVLREMRGRVPLRDKGVQGAAFVVLKAPDLPSALFESGYISNPDDASRLASPAGRKAFAEAMSRAVRVYFARQLPPTG